jgi:SAM-dependent methyltransferase
MNIDAMRTAFDRILHEQEEWSLKRLDYHRRRMLAGLEVKDKRVLDIGCGRGAFAILFALSGAKRVVGIDPAGDGGEPTALEALPARIEQLGLTNCEFLPVPLTPGMFEAESFDLLFLYNSINHIHEVTSDLREDQVARQAYNELFAEMFRITAPGGSIVMCDCARSNLFAPLVRRGFGHPVPGTNVIEWDKHQEPQVWQELLTDAGFVPTGQSWYLPFPLRRLGKLIDNWAFNFCTFSHFTLRARRDLRSFDYPKDIRNALL